MSRHRLQHSLGVFFGIAIIAWSARGQTVRLEGDFSPATTTFDAKHTRVLSKTIRLWDSWEGDDAHTGRLTYGPLALGRTLELMIAGFPISAEERIYLADLKSREILVLSPHSPPGELWVRYRWDIPASWAGRSVQLVAEDTSNEPGGWVGLSEPLPPSSQLNAALRGGALQIAAFLLLLLPGVAALSWFRCKHSSLALAVLLIVNGLVGYAIFFAYLFHPTLGRIASWIIFFASLAAVGLSWRRLWEWFRKPAFSAPLALALFAAIFYFEGGFLYGSIESPDGVPMERFLPYMPPDPLLPHMLAEKLVAHEPLKPFFGDWLTSDRPPLQAGLNLLVWPILPQKGYIAVGIAAQCWVWIGLWIFLDSFRVGSRPRAIILSGAIFSGFFFLNSFFCWPKLLPTAFLMIAAAFLWKNKAIERPSIQDGIVSGICVGLSLLGHGGSFFGVVGIALVYCLQRRKLGWRVAASGGTALMVVLLPWQLYQRYLDPPGDRLVKYHLAGHEAVDLRPSLTVIREAYAQLTWREIAKNKLLNFRKLFWENSSLIDACVRAVAEIRKGQPALAFVHLAHHLRDTGFLFYFQMPGPMLAGFLGFGWMLIRQNKSPETEVGLTAALLALASIIAWCLLMFKGGSTVIHQSSYFIGACLYIVAGIGLAAWPLRACVPVLIINLAWFVAVWVIAPQFSDDGNILFPSSFLGFWLVWAVTGAMITACLFRIAKLPAADDSYA